MNKKQVNIGNENFRTWLKNLDHSSRVEKMSAIAKTQASAGLKGTLIKKSLAQLSQRCQVMLIRLTDTDIKRYTRQISENRIVDAKNKLNQGTLKHGVKSKDGFSNQCHSKKELVKNLTTIKCSTDAIDASKISKPNFKSLKSTTKSDKKLKKKFQELFGDDFDDTPTTYATASNSSSHNNTNIKSYLSTTVNVNIYNSPSSRECESESSFTKQTSVRENNLQNSLLNTNDIPKKRLRIDVSLSDDHNVVDLDSFQTPHNNTTKQKLSQSKAKRNRDKYKKQKSIKLVSSSTNANTTTSEEDPSIQELWSIFGMKSPSDRSESIKSIPPHITEESNNRDNVPSENCNIKLNYPIIKTRGTQEIEVNDTVTSLTTSGKNQSTNEIGSKCASTSLVASGSPISEELKPVCKISGTFSLADIQSQGPSSTEESTFILSNVNNSGSGHVSECIDPAHINTTERHISVSEPNSSTNKTSSCDDDNTKNVQATTVKRAVRQNVSTKTNSSTVETISLIDDDDTEVRENHKNPMENSRVGTIRVKSLGVLMNPQPNSTTLCQNTTVQSDHENSVISDNQPSVEECFLNKYRYYFDEIVESKIPKLGDMLHLAIADIIRRNERVKRAEQLSSIDLIKEEKQRAEKDFNDMMKIRGNEFSPLCGMIIKKFDTLSKLTLFLALFCRIIKHAEQIDPSNKNHIDEARQVVYTMLLKHQCRENTVMDSLLSNENEFKVQLEIVSRLTEKAMKQMDSFNNSLLQAANNTHSELQGPLGDHLQNPLQLLSTSNSQIGSKLPSVQNSRSGLQEVSVNTIKNSLQVQSRRNSQSGSQLESANRIQPHFLLQSTVQSQNESNISSVNQSTSMPTMGSEAERLAGVSNARQPNRKVMPAMEIPSTNITPACSPQMLTNVVTPSNMVYLKGNPGTPMSISEFLATCKNRSNKQTLQNAIISQTLNKQRLSTVATKGSTFTANINGSRAHPKSTPAISSVMKPIYSQPNVRASQKEFVGSLATVSTPPIQGHTVANGIGTDATNVPIVNPIPNIVSGTVYPSSRLISPAVSSVIKPICSQPNVRASQQELVGSLTPVSTPTKKGQTVANGIGTDATNVPIVNSIPNIVSGTVYPSSRLISPAVSTVMNPIYPQPNRNDSLKGLLGSSTTINSPQKNVHAVVNGLGTEAANVQTIQPSPIIVRSPVGSSNPAILGMESITYVGLNSNNGKSLLSPINRSIISANSSTIPATVTRAKAITTTTNCAAAAARASTIDTSRTDQTASTPTPEQLTLSNILKSHRLQKSVVTAASTSTEEISLPTILDPPVQSQVPSSSHCHPFVRRMPISGKMRMLFDRN